MALLILTAAVLWLAYSNGANDNFKGVATLYGSGVASYGRALTWATVTTMFGSLISILLAERLVMVFSGAGLLPDYLLGNGQILLTVAGAAAATVFLATLLGMPTSTTHALAGALLGIAWASSSLTASWPAFLTLFATPLLLSPLLAIALTGASYPLLHRVRLWLGVTSETCVCLERPLLALQTITGAGNLMTKVSAPASLTVGTASECLQSYRGTLLGVQAQTTANSAHYLSAGAVCFSRAVNDTPKIAALLLALGAYNRYMALSLVTLAVVIGGLVQSRRVADTMSLRLTNLNTGQGLCANLVTAVLVLLASRLGVPVSTTHVSVGSIFGIGLVQGSARWKTIAAVLTTWVTTLPLAAALSATGYHVLKVVAANT